MKTITFYVVALVCLLTTSLSAQETFEKRAETIAKNIEQITKQEKDSLKVEVERVNQMLDKGEINSTEAETRKQQMADLRAKNIETRVALEQQKLEELVKDKVDGRIADSPKKKFSFTMGGNDSDSTKVKEVESFKRTTSQFVFAIGVNRLITDGKMDHDTFKWRSDFYEWGLTLNTRILKNNNLLHFKYGLSLQYNNLRPEHDQIFEKQGDQTVLVDSGLDLDVSRLRYVNLVVPMHLEFDFTPKEVNGDKTYFKSHESVRLGVGGYAGLNVKEKQILKYEDEAGNKVKQKTKGDFNVNDFVYGVSAYLGYGQFALYAKYDLQPLFADNAVDQNNLSLGIRFDFN
ncbi:MAG: hypothetical protein EOO45_11770 [Flavobacterium sp.]|nr:MAG: hypothetical protein EOO45_11770 [Flavobacterium sp.]